MKTLEIQKAEEIIKWRNKEIDKFLIETVSKKFSIEIEIHELSNLSEKVIIKSSGEEIGSKIFTVEIN
jgi:hypothetical protein